MSNTEKLQQIYLAALDNYKTEIDSDGDIRFSHPDLGRLYISLDADRDPEYFRMVFPNFADSNALGGFERTEMIAFANEVNSRNKVVKVTINYLNHDNTWNATVQVEAFMAAADTAPDAALVKATLGRYISAIKAGVSSFVQAMKESKAAKSSDGSDDLNSI